MRIIAPILLILALSTNAFAQRGDSWFGFAYPYSLIQSPPACTKLAQGSETNKQVTALIDTRFNWLVEEINSLIGSPTF